MECRRTTPLRRLPKVGRRSAGDALSVYRAPGAGTPPEIDEPSARRDGLAKVLGERGQGLGAEPLPRLVAGMVDLDLDGHVA